MRASALDIARRIPAATPGRAALIRRIARDAIMTDPRASLEFYAFEALGAATDASIDPAQASDAVSMIATEAAGIDAFRTAGEPWRACADFLLAQREPAAAAVFLRGRLEDPAGLPEEDVTTLARAAVACDAAAGGRAEESLALAGRLRGLGHRPFGAGDRPGSEFDAVAGIYTLLGDDAGSEFVLEAGLAVDPADGALLNNLGYARLARGVADARTEELLQQALRGRPGDSGTLDSLGWLRYLQGRFVDSPAGPGAVTVLGQAVAAAGGAVSAVQHDHLGDARWRAGDRDGARRAWSEAVRIAEGGMSRERNVELLRQVFRRQVGLAAIDAARYHDAHDGSVAEHAKGKLDAAKRGEEPSVAPVAPTKSP
jgi:tetratricopeptide (TPR) repeat protein